jgi:hypothetical protein
VLARALTFDAPSAWRRFFVEKAGNTLPAFVFIVVELGSLKPEL